MPSSRGPSWYRNRTWVSCIAGGFFTSWATRETPSGLYKSLCFRVSMKVLLSLGRKRGSAGSACSRGNSRGDGGKIPGGMGEPGTPVPEGETWQGCFVCLWPRWCLLGVKLCPVRLEAEWPGVLRWASQLRSLRLSEEPGEQELRQEALPGTVPVLLPLWPPGWKVPWPWGPQPCGPSRTQPPPAFHETHVCMRVSECEWEAWWACGGPPTTITWEKHLFSAEHPQYQMFYCKEPIFLIKQKWDMGIKVTTF